MLVGAKSSVLICCYTYELGGGSVVAAQDRHQDGDPAASSGGRLGFEMASARGAHELNDFLRHGVVDELGPHQAVYRFVWRVTNGAHSVRLWCRHWFALKALGTVRFGDDGGLAYIALGTALN